MPSQPAVSQALLYILEGYELNVASFLGGFLFAALLVVAVYPLTSIVRTIVALLFLLLKFALVAMAFVVFLYFLQQYAPKLVQTIDAFYQVIYYAWKGVEKASFAKQHVPEGFGRPW